MSLPTVVPRRLPRTSLLVWTVLALAVEAAQAQDDMLVLTRGSDTIAVERLRWSAGRLDGELVLRAQRLRFSYTVDLTPEGGIGRLTNQLRRADADPAAPPLQTATLRLTGDSVFVEVTSPGGQPVTQRLGTRPGALPYLNPSFALLEPLLRRARAAGRDSTTVPMFFLTGGQTLDVVVRRLGPDSVLVVFAPGQESRLRVDRRDRILGGVVPSQGLTVSRAPATGAAFFVPPPDYSAPAGAPYTATDVTVPTPLGHALAGTLTVPRGAGPFPAVVTISGSGPQDRDEEIPVVRGYRPFRQLADTLGRAGIAMLRLDDRGVGGSGGNHAVATSRDFADDIRAALAWLRTRPDIDPRRIGLIGHSEGGLIAPMIAADDRTLAALVLMAGPSRPGREILVFQHQYQIAHTASIRPEARDSALQARRAGIDSLARTNPWLAFFLEYDPRVTAARVRTPVLVLHGATDQQVTADQAEELGRAFRGGGNRDVTVRMFPAANHLFLDDPVGNPANYGGLPSGRIRDDVIRSLVEWLSERLAARPVP